MAENKTRPTGKSIREFLDKVTPARRKADGEILLEMFTRITGFPPRLWGPGIIGFGAYHYTYASGREGDMLATGFSPRKAKLVLYIMPGYQDYGSILQRLGKHAKGKSCLYVNKLDDIDLQVLEELITTGLKDLNQIWPVRAELGELGA